MRLTSTKDDTSKVHGAQPTLPGTRTSHGNKSELSPPAAPTRFRRSLGETDNRSSVNSSVHATSRPVRARGGGRRGARRRRERHGRRQEGRHPSPVVVVVK